MLVLWIFNFFYVKILLADYMPLQIIHFFFFNKYHEIDTCKLYAAAIYGQEIKVSLGYNSLLLIRTFEVYNLF